MEVERVGADPFLSDAAAGNNGDAEEMLDEAEEMQYEAPEAGHGEDQVDTSFQPRHEEIYDGVVQQIPEEGETAAYYQDAGDESGVLLDDSIFGQTTMPAALLDAETGEPLQEELLDEPDSVEAGEDEEEGLASNDNSDGEEEDGEDNDDDEEDEDGDDGDGDDEEE